MAIYHQQYNDFFQINGTMTGFWNELFFYVWFLGEGGWIVKLMLKARIAKMRQAKYAERNADWRTGSDEVR